MCVWPGSQVVMLLGCQQIYAASVLVRLLWPLSNKMRNACAQFCKVSGTIGEPTFEVLYTFNDTTPLDTTSLASMLYGQVNGIIGSSSGGYADEFMQVRPQQDCGREGAKSPCAAGIHDRDQSALGRQCGIVPCALPLRPSLKQWTVQNCCPCA